MWNINVVNGELEGHKATEDTAAYAVNRNFLPQQRDPVTSMKKAGATLRVILSTLCEKDPICLAVKKDI